MLDDRQLEVARRQGGAKSPQIVLFMVVFTAGSPPSGEVYPTSLASILAL